MIIVCSLSDHGHVCDSVKADHLISVIDPGYEPKTPTNVKYHLKLGFDDIIEINENNIIHRENETLTKFESITKSILPNNNHISKIVDLCFLLTLSTCLISVTISLPFANSKLVLE